MTREKTIALLQKLAALADASRNDSPEEAANAMARMQQIMLDSKISMLELNTTVDDSDITELDVAVNKRPPTWKIILCSMLCDQYFCQCIYSNVPIREKQKKVEIIGKADDVQAVNYVYQYLCQEIPRMGLIAANEAGVYKSQRRIWLSSFRSGCIQTIALRLKEQRESLERKLAAMAPATHALVKASDAAVNTYLYEKYGNAIKNVSRKTAVRDVHGMEAGKEAGLNINLGGNKGLSKAPTQLGARK